MSVRKVRLPDDARQLAEVLQENTDYLRQVAPDVIGANAPLTYTPELAIRTVAPLVGWVYEENGVIMSLVTYRLVRIAGAEIVFQPVHGAIRATAIRPEEREAYLFKPLEGAVPEVMALGVTRTLVRYAKRHTQLDNSLKEFSTADSNTIRDVGEDAREFLTELKPTEIADKYAVLQGKG